MTLGISRFISGLALALLGIQAAEGPSESTPASEAIIERMVMAERVRLAKLTGYEAQRHYAVENKRVGLHATMDVAVRVDPAGSKNFRILTVKAPAAVRKLVFQRMLDTEARASERSAQEGTRLWPANYDFRFAGKRDDRGRACFVFEVAPKTDNPLLIRGLIWVDAQEYAVTRIEGTPAHRPSWWVTATRFVHEYTKVGDQWLAVSNTSETDVRVFGHTRVVIEYKDYALKAAGAPHEHLAGGSQPSP